MRFNALRTAPDSRAQQSVPSETLFWQNTLASKRLKPVAEFYLRIKLPVGSATREEKYMNQENYNREIEVRFLEINYKDLIKKLHELGAQDFDEDFLREIIFYDRDLKWMYEVKKFVRLRQTKKGVFMTFKHNEEHTATGTKEIEIEVSNINKAKEFLEEIGLVAFREQEKKRHTFKLGEVTIDIDTWPSIPTYVELEGPSEQSLKEAAANLGFDWKNVCLKVARFIIEEKYGIPVSKLRFFTFDKIE